MFWSRASTLPQPTTSTALRVFISYSRDDKAIANRIAAALKDYDIDPLIDHRNVGLGLEWQRDIVSLIQQANYIIWLVSERSIDSQYCRWELSIRQYLNKGLFPVAVSTSLPKNLPRSISRLHMLLLDASSDFEKQIEEMANALLVPNEWVKQHTWLEDQASTAENRLRGKGLIAAEKWLLEQPRSPWLRENPQFAPKPTQRIEDFIVESRRLVDRDKKWILGASIFFMVLAAGAAVTTYSQWRGALRAESRSLAVASSRTTEQGDAASGLLLALKGLPDRTDFWERPDDVFDPQSALYRSLFSLRERKVFEGHKAPLTYAETSPDGHLVLTSSEDGTALLWNLKESLSSKDKDGDSYTTLSVHKDIAESERPQANMAIFSPDATKIVTIYKDSTVILWDGDGRQRARLDRHTGSVLFASFSDDSRYIITTGADYTARLWSATYGWHLKDFESHRGDVVEADFSPDGALLATASTDKTARIWRIDETVEPIILAKHQDRVLSVEFDPKGAFVATASRDDTAIIWTSGGKLFNRLIGHEGDVNRVRFAPHAPLAITASDDNTAKLWDVKTGAEISTLSGHRSRVIEADFNPDGLRLLTASVDGTIGLWRLQEDGASYKVEHIAMLRGHERDIVSAQFSADGRWIISASKDHTARLWQATEGQGFADSLSHPQDVRSFAFSNDGEKILTATKAGLVRIWDAGTHEILNEKDLLDEPHLTKQERTSKQIISVAFSTDGSLIALAHEGAAVSLHRPEGKTLAQVGKDLLGHEMRVRSVDFSSDDTRLVTSSADKTAKVWDLKTRKVLVELRGHTGRVRSAIFSPSDEQILTVSADRTAQLWDSVSGEHCRTFDMHEDDVWAAGFNPEGSMIVTGSEDGQAFITELASGESRQLVGHGDNIRSAEFSRDGHVLTSSWDRTVRLWDAKTAEELAVIPSEDIVLDAAFDPSGMRIAHLMKNLVRFRPIYTTVDKLIAAAKKKMPRQRTREERQIDAKGQALPGPLNRLRGLISMVMGER